MTFQTVRGMRDLLPAEMRKKQFVIDRLRAAFEKYGFEPLQTPALESLELLGAKGGAGEEIKREIYAFKDQGDRDVGMRFDFTVPIARVVAGNPGLPKPFKRYQIGEVWRYDRPGAERWREFTQADVDVFGVPGVAADFLCVQVAIDAMRALGFKDFKVRLNNRSVLDAMMETARVPPAKRLDAFRAIDKLDKLGWDGVRAELKARGVPKIEELARLIQKNDLAGLEKTESGKRGLAELKEFLEMAENAGVKKFVDVDLSLVRGLEYYTGLVFEITAGGKTSCGAGGRYDKLIGLYGGQPTPATGISFGVDRLVTLMEKDGLFPPLGPPAMLVAAANDDVRAKAEQVALALREKGVACETDLMGRSLRKQFDYANSRGITKILIVGPKDLAEGMVTLRDMATGKEERKKLADLTK
jgi:histidyl-tRNA synthetase